MEKIDQVDKKVITILAKNLGLNSDDNDITSSSDITNDFRIDSIQMIRIIVDIENEFNIAIDKEDFEQLNTLDSIISVILKHLAE